MKNKELQAIKLNSKHLTKVILFEFTYCIFIFLCFLFIKENIVQGYQIFIKLVYLGFLFLVPLVFNLIQVFKFQKHFEYGKSSNYIITTLLMMSLMFTFLL